MTRSTIATVTLGISLLATPALAEMCTGYGPQTPRDISMIEGSNKRIFTLAPPSTEMNLCNIHTHTNAEHRGPGFSVSGGSGVHGGWMCNNHADLTEAELTDPAGGKGAFKGIVPGNTIEVHWVHTSCDVAPGPGLGSCLSDACANPELRVETQVFLVVNDPENALDFNDFAYAGNKVDGLHQPMSLPTGPKYTEQACSPLQVTWSVRPQCAKVDVSSLYKWVEDGNVFEEEESHGVRQLVTAQELLSRIR
jgi:hypothetical protein